jgi:ribosomal protein S18 acetylase RimI-like enzyme
MIDGTRALAVTPLLRTDIVGLAQCMVIDADVFPYASIPMGLVTGIRIWIARADGSTRVLGFVAASGRALSFYVHGLAVAPSDRRRGIGRALLGACVGWARAARLGRVVLHVSTANEAAVGLYESEGFEVRRQVSDFYRPGVYAERAAYEMVLAVA